MRICPIISNSQVGRSIFSRARSWKVSSTVQKITNTIGPKTESKSLFAKIGYAVARAMINLNTNITNRLDINNKLEIRY